MAERDTRLVSERAKNHLNTCTKNLRPWLAKAEEMAESDFTLWDLEKCAEVLDKASTHLNRVLKKELQAEGEGDGG